MNNTIESRLNRLVNAGQQHLLKNGLKGLEKESLRITPDGIIAKTAHPKALGSALTHPFITTDYSEALIELITPPFERVEDTLAFLEDLHGFVYQNIGDELLLATSMPCDIENEESIPLAEYGDSNIGHMKHVYRRGLAWRYGRAMQAIAGIHFNYSVNQAFWPVFKALLQSDKPLDTFIADEYFGLIRNTLRYGWVIPYLLGSSPAVSQSFFVGREISSKFSRLDGGTLYRPYATSLRMSDIGYRNDGQAKLGISFNHLDEYVESLSKAINTPYQAYQAYGVKVDGDYRQLNANILQIENEYYSSIRPKQIAQSGEKPTLALKRRGVRYIELRSVDLSCTHSAGIGASQLRFLELFLLYCLLEESPSFGSQDYVETNRNSLAAACCGRTPGFKLLKNGGEVLLSDWLLGLGESMLQIASILDEGDASGAYQQSLKPLFDAVEEPESTPSAGILAGLQKNHESFQAYALRLSKQHAADFQARPLSELRLSELQAAARQSLQEQADIEASDSLSFDAFLNNYFNQA